MMSSAFVEYVAAGLAICPIAPGSKGPRLQGWQTRERAITSPEQALALNGAGLLHAWSRTAALDIDDLHGAAAWLSVRGIELDELLAADDAVQITSGRPNRAKLLYRLPQDITPLTSHKVSDSNGVLFELRCASAEGLSVQDVLPPSVHPETGRPYRWAGAGDWRALPDLPPDLLALWQSLSGERPTGAPTLSAPGKPIAAGMRNDQLFRMGCQLRAGGWSERAIFAALCEENAERCSPPLDRGEVQAIAHSAAKYQPGSDNAAALVNRASKSEPAALATDPLAAMSAWIVTEDQVKQMEATRLIWRDMIALAHVAAWVAPANGGKTTIAKQAAADLAEVGFRVMFFQEDASAGDLPALFEHAQCNGYSMLNSTLSGTDPEEQVDVLQGLAKSGSDLSNFVLIFDTLKKYSDLMSKRGSREFFKTMRALSQRGATVVLLGHTNKHKGLDGKLVFEGVGDVRNDVDELIYIEASEKDPAGCVTFTMTPDKVRCKAKPLTFRLDTQSMQLEQVDQVVDVRALNEATQRRRADGDVIDLVLAALKPHGKTRTKLVEEVHDGARSLGRSRRDVERVIDEYCGTSHANASALWVESRMLQNNARYITRKTGSAS